jgi:hypothetical protein
MKLYDFLESENIEREYKEFFFKINFEKYFDKSQIFQFLFDDKLNPFDINTFNSYLIDNFQVYFENYLPKFIASIQNNIDIQDSASIFFGINDKGYVTGIPYINIDSNFIRKIEKKIKKILYKNLRIYDNNKFIELFDEWFNENIQINIPDIDISNFIFSNKYKNYLNKWINQKNEYKKKVNELKKQQSDFIEEHRLYTQKLENMIKEPIIISKLINFIEINSSKENPLINQILNNEKFNLYDNIHQNMNDKNHILYYITKFKDMKINEIKKKRPITTYVPSVIPIDFIFQNIQNMLELWIKKGYKFCYIQVKYLNNNKKNFIFSLLYKMKWRYSIRIIKSIGDPGTHIMNFDIYQKTKELVNWRQNRTQEQLNSIVSKILSIKNFD